MLRTAQMMLARALVVLKCGPSTLDDSLLFVPLALLYLLKRVVFRLFLFLGYILSSSDVNSSYSQYRQVSEKRKEKKNACF